MSTATQPFDEFDTSTPDGGLGTTVQFDRDRPPLGSFVFGPAYDGTCFILKDNLLYYCKPKQPEAWPSLFFVEVSTPQFPLQTGLLHNGQIFTFSKKDLYYIVGTGNGTFLPYRKDAKTGAQSIRGAISITGKGIYHTGPDGIYLFNGSIDTKITERTLEPIFRGETVEGLPGVATMSGSLLWAFQNNLYFGYRSAGQDYPGNVLVVNLDTNKTSYFVYNDGAEILVRSIAVDSTNSRLLIGDHQGFVRVIENTAYTADSDEAIAWEAQSKDYTLPTRAHFPRFIKYDIDASNATVTGAMLLDGVIHQSHTVLGDRVTKRRLVGEGNGNKATIRLSGTGPVELYGTEFE